MMSTSVRRSMAPRWVTPSRLRSLYVHLWKKVEKIVLRKWSHKIEFKQRFVDDKFIIAHMTMFAMKPSISKLISKLKQHGSYTQWRYGDMCGISLLLGLRHNQDT